MKVLAYLLIIILTTSLSSLAQQTAPSADAEETYTRTINTRADKIVANLDITDTKKSINVRNIIADHYRNLNAIYTVCDNKIKTIKSEQASDKEAMNASLNKVQEAATKSIDSLHPKFLARLSKQLSQEQIVKVKDGLTYNVLPITYKGYQDMILTLTEEQKKKIMEWLVEAREHAMDAESSDKKHAWFGKYKGRINNYLSAAGYDLRKEGDEWTKRRNAQKSSTSSN